MLLNLTGRRRALKMHSRKSVSVVRLLVNGQSDNDANSFCYVFVLLLLKVAVANSSKVKVEFVVHQDQVQSLPSSTTSFRVVLVTGFTHQLWPPRTAGICWSRRCPPVWDRTASRSGRGFLFCSLSAHEEEMKTKQSNLTIESSVFIGLLLFQRFFLLQ